MEVLEIIPFYKSFKKDTLSYFSAKNVPVGSIVTVTIRGREIKGLVVSKKEISDQKTEIKNNLCLFLDQANFFRLCLTQEHHH
jgi:hypothetical protein